MRSGVWLAALSSALTCINGLIAGFAVNIDTGGTASGWLSSLAPYRWYGVIAMTLLTILLQVLADPLATQRGASQAESLGRRRNARYLVLIFLWIAGLGGATLFLDGVQGLGDWRLWVLALLGVALIWLLKRWIATRFHRLILLARFAYFGAPDAAHEADALRSRVAEALDAALRAVPGSPTFEIRKVDTIIDAADGDGRRRAMKLARDYRAVVVVTGAIRQDSSELSATAAVLTPPDLATGRPDPSPGRRVLLSNPPEAIVRAKELVAEDAAKVARLALGVALLRVRRYEEAEAVLRTLAPTDALGTFFAAYAAFAQEKYNAAAELGLLSHNLQPWAPALAIAAYSKFELGQPEQGVELFKALAEESLPRPMGPPWDSQVMLLEVFAQFRAIRHLLDRDIADLERLAEEASRVQSHMAPYRLAVERQFHGDPEGALRVLAANMDNPLPSDLALDAAAAVAAGLPDAAARTATAEHAVMRSGETNAQNLGWLLHAYSRLRDVDACLRVLRQLPPDASPLDRAMIRSMHLHELRDDPRVDELLEPGAAGG